MKRVREDGKSQITLAQDADLHLEALRLHEAFQQESDGVSLTW